MHLVFSGRKSSNIGSEFVRAYIAIGALVRPFGAKNRKSHFKTGSFCAGKNVKKGKKVFLRLWYDYGIDVVVPCFCTMVQLSASVACVPWENYHSRTMVEPCVKEGKLKVTVPWSNRGYDRWFYRGFCNGKTIKVITPKNHGSTMVN